MKKIISLLLAIVLGSNICAFAEGVQNVSSSESIYYTYNPVINEHNALVADLGKIYSVEAAEVTQEATASANLDNFELYLSSDGKNYAFIGNGENLNKDALGSNSITYMVPAKSYARYVKLVMNAQEGKSFDVKNINILGSAGREQERIDKKATYTYYTQQPYQTKDDIRVADRYMTKLTDGDTNKMIATDGNWINVVIDLKGAYQIGDVDIYSLAEGNTFMEGCEIRYSLDGKKFFTYTYYLNDNSRDAGIVKSSFSGMPGRYARFLKIIMQGQAENIAISEIEVNGYPVVAEAAEICEVPLRVEMKNYLLAYLDWSTHNNTNVSKYALYVEKTPFTDTQGLVPVAEYKKGEDAFTYKYATKSYLEPQTTYYFAITPFDTNGNELKMVTPVKITTQGVLGEKVRDIFNIHNHPGYDGGSTVGFGSYTENMKKEAVRLIDEMGAFNKNRWWTFNNTDTRMYADIGISTFLINPSMTPSQKYGNYMYSYGNENDWKYMKNPQGFYPLMINSYEPAKAADSRNLLCQPSLGGTKQDCMNWLDKLYELGNGDTTKNAFDVLDVHLYCQKEDSDEIWSWGISSYSDSAPELVSRKLDNIRSVMAKYGDGDKPIISTECGFQTSDVDNFASKTTYETHRDYAVRLYTLMIAQGVREAWWYNFHDDGPDENDTEHNFGLVDYFGTPKPAYYGFYNMYQQLKNTEYVGKVSGDLVLDFVQTFPYTTYVYGHEFYDETKNKVISIVWSADEQDKQMQFKTLSGKDEEIEVIGTDGSFKVINTTSQEASVEIGGSPIFIYTEGGIEAKSFN